MSLDWHNDRQRTGFTLIEMLLVIAIMAILLVSGSMVTTSVFRSSKLSTDAAGLANELARASLDAVKMNQSVKVRFYRFNGTSNTVEPLVQAYQMLTLDANSSRHIPLDKIIFLGQGVAFHDSDEASTILSLPENTPISIESTTVVTDPELPMIAPYTYYEFEFRPDGSTNLPKDQTWGIVLAFHDDGRASEVPKNFRAIGINPFTGAVKRY